MGSSDAPPDHGVNGAVRLTSVGNCQPCGTVAAFVSPSVFEDDATPHVDDLDCQGQRDVVLSCEWSDPRLSSEHFSTVTIFNLEHPSRFRPTSPPSEPPPNPLPVPHPVVSERPRQPRLFVEHDAQLERDEHRTGIDPQRR